MRPVIFSWALAAASANNIALSQSLAGAGSLTLNGAAASGGVATLDVQRRVIVTSVGNDSALTWTVRGTNQSGAPITDSFAGANAGAASSNLDFKTVTSIAGSAATASTVTAGTSATGSSPWYMPSYHATPFELQIETILTGTATYNIEYTMDDFYTPAGQATVPWPAAGVPAVRTALSASSASASTTLTHPLRGWRVTITAGTGSLSVEADQSGITNY